MGRYASETPGGQHSQISRRPYILDTVQGSLPNKRDKQRQERPRAGYDLLRHQQPVQIIVAKAETSRSVIGIVDGLSSLAIESEDDKQNRSKLVRDLGYKK